MSHLLVCTGCTIGPAALVLVCVCVCVCVCLQHKQAASPLSNVLALTKVSHCQQDDSKSRAGSRFSIGDRPRPLAATMSSPSTAANRRLSMPTIAGSAQQGQENTPPPVHPARQTLLGNALAGSSRHSSCRVRNSSDMLAFPGFVTKCNVSFPTSPPEAAVPKMSPGATGITMGMVGKEPVVSVSSNQADAAVTMGPASGTPISPPSLTERTCETWILLGCCVDPLPTPQASAEMPWSLLHKAQPLLEQV